MKNRVIVLAGALVFATQAFAFDGDRDKPKPGPRPEPPRHSSPPPRQDPRPAPAPKPGYGGGGQPAPRPQPAPVPRPQPAPVPRPQPAPAPAPRPQPAPQPAPAPRPDPKPGYGHQPAPAPKPGYGHQPAPAPRPQPPAPAPVPSAPAPKPGYGQQPVPRPPQQGPIAAPRPQPAPVPAIKPGYGNIGVRPGAPVNQVQPPRVIPHQQPSHLSRPVTQQNISASYAVANRYRNANPIYVNRVNSYGNIYYNQYNTIIVNRTVIINNYYSQPAYRYYYSSYYRHGFYGGYYYPVRPCYTIHNYFWYPTIYWMYVNTWDDDYYRVWYPTRYRVEPFKYTTVYYPTDTLRDLGVELSGMGEYEQYGFRQGLTIVTSKIEQQISQQLVSSYALQANDIVVNHYENLMNQAIVLEGLADADNMHLAFKALIDLRNPSQTMVFMPTDQNPTQYDLAALQVINQRIINLGGNPYAADEEPVNWTSELQ